MRGTKVKPIEDDVNSPPQDHTESVMDGINLQKLVGKSLSKYRRKPDDDDELSTFISQTFKKQECNRFRRDETIKNETNLCKCGYSEGVHLKEAFQNGSEKAQDLQKKSPTDAFGKLDYVEDEDDESDWKNIRYVRMDHETGVKSIMTLFDKWEMEKPYVIFSVVPDNESSTDKCKEVTESELHGQIQKIRKKVCSSLVEAVTSTNAWIITGGRDSGVDKLVGNEAKRRVANENKNIQAVIGISNWGCFGDKISLLIDLSGPIGCAADTNQTGLTLNRHHTHFLLVDDGTQKKTECECVLRRAVELELSRKKTNEVKIENNLNSSFIYILIGGGISSLSFVKQALEKQIPALVVTGTGGAADIISKESKDGANSEEIFLEEIFEQLFLRLKELLDTHKSVTDEIRQTIAKFKEKIKDQKFFENLKLLEIFKKPQDSGTNNNSAENIDSDTVKQMRDSIVKMLVNNGIPPEMAKQTVDDLETPVISETLTKVHDVYELLNNIRAHKKSDLLVNLHVNADGKQQEEFIRFTSGIKDILKKVKMNNPGDLFLLAADWDDKELFKQLLDDEQRNKYHQEVLMGLLKKNKKQYVEWLMDHNRNSNWLTNLEDTSDAVLEGDETWKKLKEKHDDQRITEEKRFRLKGKIVFIWCVRNRMPETAMLFWKRGQDCLAMILLAYCISRKLKKKLVDKEGYDEMVKQMQFFSQHAINFLKLCHADKNRKRTQALLVGKVKNLGENLVTPLDIAAKAKLTTFISLVPVQDLLNNIWVKDVEDYAKYYYVPMLLSAACPLLAPKIFKFRKSIYDDDETSNHSSFDRATMRTMMTWKQNGNVYTRARGYFKEFKSFVDTPVVKFAYGLVSYIGYLLLFSVVMLTDFRRQMGWREMVLSCWTGVLFIEEWKQVIAQKSEYVNIYNFFDMGAIIMYIVGFILRMIYLVDPTICLTCLYVARIILAFSLLIFFLRSLQYLWIFNNIGPKIYMMSRLIKDLISFLLIMMVFIAGYGVFSNIILYPNQPLNLDLFHDVFYDATWSVLQQFNREETEGSLCDETNVAAKYCSSMSDDNIDYELCKENQCPANDWIVSVVLAFYALFTGIMLLNVLIAMFNATFTTITENERGVSKLQRYQLIREYSDQLMIPTPLCVITYPYFIYKCLRKMCNKSGKRPTENEDVEAQSTDSDKKQTGRKSRSSKIQNMPLDFQKPQTGNEDVEAQSTNKEKKQNGNKSRISKSQKTPFEMILSPAVKSWERDMVVKYLKEDKEEKEKKDAINQSSEKLMSLQLSAAEANAAQESTA